MTFKIDYRDGAVYRWRAGADGPAYTVDEDYTPTFYVAAGNTQEALSTVRSHLAGRRAVLDTAVERWRTVWREEPEMVLRVDVADLEALSDLAYEVRGWGDPGEYTLYNVDFGREFRYCLETGCDPTPQRALSMLTLSLPTKALNDGDVSALCLDGDLAGETAAEAIDELQATLETRDPDVLVIDSASMVPLLYETAKRYDRSDFELGRLPGWQELAVESTFESYGTVRHSPARYNVFGRAIVDRSNSFFWNQTNLGGLLDLVERSKKPLQETAWASIGNVLTSIQIREAISRGVLVPWNSWRHEQFKPLSTLHEADRGGFIFSPDVGFHDRVHELDFSSLYPKIMVTRNISPETIRCACHREREDVPGLGYSICDDDGYLQDVLQPILDDRDRYKAEIALLDDVLDDGLAEGADAATIIDTDSIVDTDSVVTISTDTVVTSDSEVKIDVDLDGELDPAEENWEDIEEVLEARRQELQGRSSALKWILVSCFGYQGFSNAKFGRIECHEAINAFAREIILDTKAALEEHGWRVVHGIVDSVWVQALPGEQQTPLPELADEISAMIGIELEYEAEYDWIAFVPRADSDEGALNRYFGKVADSDAFKKRGIELRQRSTPPYVEDCQQAWLETLDEHREPAPVCEQLRLHLAELRSGEVDPMELVIRRRVSQPFEEYTQYTHNAAALERAGVQHFEVAPGEDVEYVVVDDEKDSAARVQLAYESPSRYDAAFYATMLIRAAESIVSPFGWDRRRIRQYLAESTDAAITMY